MDLQINSEYSETSVQIVYTLIRCVYISQIHKYVGLLHGPANQPWIFRNVCAYSVISEGAVWSGLIPFFITSLPVTARQIIQWTCQESEYMWRYYMLVHSRVGSKNKVVTVNVLKFWTLVTSQKGLDKQCRPRSDCFWSGSSLFAIKCSKFLEHLLYIWRLAFSWHCPFTVSFLTVIKTFFLLYLYINFIICLNIYSNS